MAGEKTLFDDDTFLNNDSEDKSANIKKEVLSLDRLKNLEEKITTAVEKVKALKDEKNSFDRRIKDLENLLNKKEQEIEALKSEKTSIKTQVEELLDEIETLEI